MGGGAAATFLCQKNGVSLWALFPLVSGLCCSREEGRRGTQSLYFFPSFFFPSLPASAVLVGSCGTLKVVHQFRGPVDSPLTWFSRVGIFLPSSQLSLFSVVYWLPWHGSGPFLLLALGLLLGFLQASNLWMYFLPLLNINFAPRTLDCPVAILESWNSMHFWIILVALGCLSVEWSKSLRPGSTVLNKSNNWEASIL